MHSNEYFFGFLKNYSVDSNIQGNFIDRIEELTSNLTEKRDPKKLAYIYEMIGTIEYTLSQFHCQFNYDNNYLAIMLLNISCYYHYTNGNKEYVKNLANNNYIRQNIVLI